jgi:hypothetical protein
VPAPLVLDADSRGECGDRVPVPLYSTMSVTTLPPSPPDALVSV